VILPLQEINVLGVLVAPFAICVPVALASAAAVCFALRRIPSGPAWIGWPAIELSLLIGFLSAFVLQLGRL